MPTLDPEPRIDAFALHERVSVDDAEWDELLRSDPRAHVAQRPSFLRALAGPRARWMEVRDRQGVLRAGIGFEERRKGPLRMRVSGVAGTYGGPVAAPGDAAAEERLAAHFGRRTPDLAHLEMVWAGQVAPRGAWTGLRPLPTAELRVEPQAPFEQFLSGVFGRKGRKECNRSERHGLVATREHDATAWSDFAAQLGARGAAWGTNLPAPDVVARLVDEHQELTLFAVRDAQRAVVGVHLVLALSDELFAWVGTTARIEGANPATLLLREEARYAHACGMQRVNLGSSLGIDGVQRYKEMLGATQGERWILRWRPWWRGRGGSR